MQAKIMKMILICNFQLEAEQCPENKLPISKYQPCSFPVLRNLALQAMKTGLFHSCVTQVLGLNESFTSFTQSSCTVKAVIQTVISSVSISKLLLLEIDRYVCVFLMNQTQIASTTGHNIKPKCRFGMQVFLHWQAQKKKKGKKKKERLFIYFQYNFD